MVVQARGVIQVLSDISEGVERGPAIRNDPELCQLSERFDGSVIAIVNKA